MTTFEKTSILVGALGLLVNGALFVVFFLQLRELRRQIKGSSEADKRDHERRRKQATIEFYAATLERRNALRHELAEDRDSEAITRVTEKLREQGKSAPEWHSVVEYLNLWETLATGVNSDVLDYSTISRLSGQRVISIVRNYWSWIDWRRSELASPSVYSELETLATRIADERGVQLLSDAIAFM